MNRDFAEYAICPEPINAGHMLLTLDITGKDAAAVDLNTCRFQPRGIIDVLKGLPSLNDSTAIKEVIFHDPATIVYWEDGTKTVVKCQDEEFDKEKGLLAAIAKKVYGNKGNFNNIIKKHCETVTNG
jgi:hypothetical protein